MKITAITVWQMDLPLSHPYSLSGGRLKYESLDSTFVRIDTDEAISGWGESCPWGHTYLPAHGPGARAGIETLAPFLIGEDPRSLDHINRVMDIALPGHPAAKSAIDIACWDILGKASGLPLWQLLGGATADPVPVNSSIGTGTPDEMIAKINTASQKGYRTHSAKIGGTDAAADIARIEAISTTLPPGQQVTFDVNRAWSPGMALRVLNAVSSTDWVEQPCETMDECAYVAARVGNPILLDECLHDIGDHLAAWRADACAGMKVKPGRVGGLTKARQIRDFGLSVGWQMHIEDVGGTALADTAAIQLASSTLDTHRMASWLCYDHLAIDPVAGQGARNINGFAAPPSVPGLGVTPDEGALGAPESAYP
ncbi:MAG: mandelate racemase/muconate lactonizing enzyme family protein [Pseudomonadota bacterium]